MSRIRPATLRRVALVTTSAVLAACTAVIAPDDPAPEENGGLLGFQDCEPPFVFDGESTIAALGIEAEGLTHERTIRGRIRITRDIITHEEFAPPGAPVHVPEGQVLCVEWANGGGMAMMLPERWDRRGAVPAPGDVPVALLVIGSVVLVGGVVSWVAFRRDRGRPS